MDLATSAAVFGAIKSITAPQAPAADVTGGKLAGQTTSLSFVHRGLKGGTTYYYRVVAEDGLSHVSTGVTAQAKTKGVTAPILQLLLLN